MVEDHVQAAAAAFRETRYGASPTSSTALSDFFAYLPAHQYIYRPTGDLWPGSSVNGALQPWPLVGGKSKAPAEYLDQHAPVHQMTWIPGEPELIEDRVVASGGWRDKHGVRVYNLYRPPASFIGDADKAGPWREHLEVLYGAEATHVESWLAHRIQRPGEKVNHALVLGGPQGIGKDTLLEPVKQGVGPWNFSEISPVKMLGRFNGWVKSVIVRVSEARDLGDVDRFAFYDHAKTYIAAPPDVLTVDEKNIREHAVFNVCGVVITTNHLTDGIYLPPDDRRHFVAWTDLQKEAFSEGYWTDLWGWYGRGGIGHVVTHLRELDLSRFNPKAPPPRTAAFDRIVAAGGAPEDAELADVLDALDRPEALTLDDIIGQARADRLHDLADELEDRKRRRALPHKLERVGYVAVRNPDAEDGLWKVSARRRVIYAIRRLCTADQIRAARTLSR